jgi:hypothetical protein
MGVRVCETKRQECRTTKTKKQVRLKYRVQENNKKKRSKARVC